MDGMWGQEGEGEKRQGGAWVDDGMVGKPDERLWIWDEVVGRTSISADYNSVGNQGKANLKAN